MDDITETGICILCGATYAHYGNNPEPLEPYEAGRCCDDCNNTKVIPARISGLTRREDHEAVEMVKKILSKKRGQ